MIIHVVKENDTLSSIANTYNVSPTRLAYDNQLPSPSQLVIGQSLLVLQPQQIHTVRPGENLTSIAAQYELNPLDLVRNNPFLVNSEYLTTGQSIVIRYTDQPVGNLVVGGYAYPFIRPSIFAQALPYLTDFYSFSYGFRPTGELIPIDDLPLISDARSYGVEPILVLTPLSDRGTFSNQLVHTLAQDEALQNSLITNLLNEVRQKNYAGVDVDFEYIRKEDGEGFVNFVQKLTQTLNENGFTVTVALAPKESADQPGLLYEGVDYAALGQAANAVLLMTYGSCKSAHIGAGF